MFLLTLAFKELNYFIEKLLGSTMKLIHRQLEKLDGVSDQNQMIGKISQLLNLLRRTAHSLRPPKTEILLSLKLIMSQ